jgi:hypothetical protein
MTDNRLPLDVIARYAPTPASTDVEWSAARRQEVLTDIIGNRAADGRSDVYMFPLQFVTGKPVQPGPRRAGRYVLAGSVAVLVAMAGVLIAVLPSNRSSDRQPSAGAVFAPPPGLSNAATGEGQISYRVIQQTDLNSSGAPDPNSQDAMVDRNWVSANGDIRSVRTGSQTGCYLVPLAGTVGFENPTLTFFASLPTDVTQLNSYIRNHVEGSSSHDEAVFVAVGDALSTADGLASPRLRAAMVGVLSLTPGVTIHENVQDYLGRPALRADFVNQEIRPGEVESLYFDPTSFQLTESRDGSNSAPSTYNGPSPAYEAPAPAPASADDPDGLTGAGFVEVMQSESVLDVLPSVPTGCVSQ